MLSRMLDRSVIDKTELPARYDVNLEFSREGLGMKQGAADSSVAEGPSIFTALKEQLGLRLVPAKGPVDFLVIERAEKASDN